MIGIVLVTHGNLGHEFIQVLDHVLGPQEKMISLAIQPHDDMDAKRIELHDKVKSVDQGQGIIVLTDMFGGTPSNIALTLLDRDHVEVIAGFNLPMLIKLASMRKSHSLDEVVHEAQEAGKKYMQLASTLLKK